MAYINPKTVHSPKGRVSGVDVLYDKGPAPFSWSIAKLKWDGDEAIGIRWNGDADDSSLGLPQSRGIPTWFIVPKEIADAVMTAAKALEADKDDLILRGYREMAADSERESDAEAWSEAMIGDGFEAR